MGERQRRIGRQDICFLAVFVAIFCLYLYKLPLGLPSGDEAFTLTVPKRLMQGDALLWDEWHGVQLIAFLTTPILGLGEWLLPNMGMVLRSRFLYLLVHAVISAVIYVRLKDRGWAAVPAVGLLFLFTPFDIPAFGYNMLAGDLVVLTGVLLYTAQGKSAWLCAGLVFSGAVLCTPYLVLFFFLGVLAMLIWCSWTRDLEPLWKGLCFCGGCALMAAAFFAFVFSRATPDQVMEALPYIFADPAHPVPSLLNKGRSYLEFLRDAGGLPLAVMLGIAGVAGLDWKRTEHPLVYFVPAALGAAWMGLWYVPTLITQSYHYPLLPICLLGLIAFELTPKRDWRLFCTVYLLGVGETFAIHITSNQGGLVITALCAVPAVASVFFVGDFLARQWQAKEALRRWLAAGLAGVAALVLLGELTYTKVEHKFWSTLPNSALTMKLDRGPYKGFKVGQTAGEKYYVQLDALEKALGDRTKGRVSYPAGATWHNLIFPELGVGCFSGWLEDGRSATVDRWAAYYELDPDRVPEYLCFFGTRKWDMEEVKAKILDPWGFEPEDWGELTVYVRKDSR